MTTLCIDTLNAGLILYFIVMGDANEERPVL